LVSRRVVRAGQGWTGPVALDGLLADHEHLRFRYSRMSARTPPG
jgi:hypothetical protein